MGEKVKDSSRLKLWKLLFIYKALSLIIPPFSKSSSYCTLPVLSLSSSGDLSGSSTTFSSSATALSSGSLSGSSTPFSSSAAALSSGSLSAHLLHSCHLHLLLYRLARCLAHLLHSRHLQLLKEAVSLVLAQLKLLLNSCVLAQLKLLLNSCLLKRNIV